MGFGCIAGGVILFILSTFVRNLTQIDAEISMSRFRKLFGIPSYRMPDLFFGTMGQFMGILWIVVGILIIKIGRWLIISPFGIFVEMFLAFSPAIIGGLILKVVIIASKKS